MIREEIFYITLFVSLLILGFLIINIMIMKKQNDSWKKDYKKLSNQYRDHLINDKTTKPAMLKHLLMLKAKDKNKNV